MGKNSFPPRFFMEHLLQGLHGVDAPVFYRIHLQNEFGKKCLAFIYKFIYECEVAEGCNFFPFTSYLTAFYSPAMTGLCSVHCVTRRIVQNNFVWTVRSLSTSTVVNGRKSRDPYDRRFGVNPRDVAPHKKGGTIELAQKLGRGGN